MENPFKTYEPQFSIDERKILIGEALKKLRKAKGIQQKELGELLGIKQATYSGYESGRAEPPVELLVRLSYFYGVSMDFITQRDHRYRGVKDLISEVDGYEAELERLKTEAREKNVMSAEDAETVFGTYKKLLDVARALGNKAQEAEADTETE